MINKAMFFNRESINIFVDASITTVDGEMIGCPGFCVYYGDLMIDQGYAIDRQSTNNISEFNAIFLGIQEALKYQNFKSVRIFSDSQTCIFALRDRIFNWIHNVRNNSLYGSGKDPIQNQDRLMEIVYFILEHNIRVEFFHQKGHVKFNRNDYLQNATNVFKTSNRIKTYVDTDLIYSISVANDYIDRYTKAMLDMNLELNDKQKAFNFYYKPNIFDEKRYRYLIKK